ncbi:MAG: hypothetical protein ACLRSW_15125 [Christensenellaceae bacterium]
MALGDKAALAREIAKVKATDKTAYTESMPRSKGRSRKRKGGGACRATAEQVEIVS